MAPLIDRDGAAPSGTTLTEPLMRASDADRLATVRILQDAVARGLLTPDEASERMATAFAAVHRRDLGPLTADLPPARSERTPPGWRPLATMAVDQVRSTLHNAATGRLHAARVAAAVLVAVLLLVALGGMTADLLFDGGGGGGGWHDHHHHDDD